MMIVQNNYIQFFVLFRGVIMKKTLSVSLAVIVALSCVSLGIVANAATPWIDNKQTGEFYWNEKSGDWEFLQVSANSARLTKYYGNAETLSVPSKINGLTVSEIGDNAFDSNTEIKKVILPNSIVKIGLRAFENCENLASVSLGTKIRSIGLNAFYNTKIYNSKMKSKNIVYIGKYLVTCNSDKYGKRLTVKDGTIGIADGAVMPQIISSGGKIKIVTLPSSVRFVGKNTFSNSKNITKITIGSKLERVGKDAFKSTKFYKNNAKAHSGAKYIGKYLCEGIYGKKSVNVKNGTTVIADGAFDFGDRKSKLQKITLPSSLKSIGESAFKKSKLTSVTIPENVKYIGLHAFLDNKNLEKIEVTKDNKYFSATSGVLFNKNKSDILVYSSALSRTAYSLPNSVKYISSYAFAGAKNLKSVKLNDGLVFIGELAFVDCKNLDSATVPNSVRRICSMAFGAVSANEGSFESKSFTLYGSNSSVARHYCEAQESDNQSYHSPTFKMI